MKVVILMLAGDVLSERSEKENEVLKGMPVTGIDKVLVLDIAEKIATELRGFPKEKSY